MKIRTIVGVASTVLFLGAATAEEQSVRILAPADGAKFTAQGPNILSYEAVGAKGSHVHIHVDDKEAASLHHSKGDYTFKELALGNHKICVKLANKAHVAMGTEQCIQVTVE
jgi:hypothetical protein